MKRIVILISGRGSNMRSIVEACAAQRWPAQVVAVIANRAEAAGLRYAQDHDIAVQVVDHKSHADREAFDVALMQAIDSHQPDVVVLGGFMRILGARFVAHYAGRLLNIHPSLLPAFAGLHTHQRALDAVC
jgi:phosphoribosylglycinamide formyltransferase-1